MNFSVLLECNSPKVSHSMLYVWKMFEIMLEMSSKTMWYWGWWFVISFIRIECKKIDFFRSFILYSISSCDWNRLSLPHNFRFFTFWLLFDTSLPARFYAFAFWYDNFLLAFSALTQHKLDFGKEKKSYTDSIIIQNQRCFQWFEEADE